MEPENIHFGGGPSTTLLHPLVAVAMVLAIVLILCLPRKYVMVPALLALFLIPQGQQIVLLGVHLNVYRIVILAGLARWVISGRSSPLAGGFNSMDRICTFLFCAYFVTNSILFDLQSQALIKNTGDLLDALGGYLVIRFLIHDREDIQRTIKVFVAVALISALCMLNEQRTGVNLFGLLGGLPGESTRDGKVRSQAAFAVFITAGTFGATLLPLLIWLWSQAKSRMASILGILAATIMAVTCHASTTLVAYAAGILGLCFWPIRKHMRLVRWGIVATFVGLHLVMHGPVWSLIEKIDLTGSSSSYHRYMLIDNFVRHFSDWWFIGTKDNGSWGWEMWDLGNQYVAYAFRGGLLAFVLFVAVISKGFSKLGTARKLAEGNRSEEWFLWCLGAALLSNVVSFFGIDYFDQMQFAWFALLAIISTATAACLAQGEDKVESQSAHAQLAHATALVVDTNWNLHSTLPHQQTPQICDLADARKQERRFKDHRGSDSSWGPTLGGHKA
jgi:hypothetical protein